MCFIIIFVLSPSFLPSLPPICVENDIETSMSDRRWPEYLGENHDP